MTAATCSNGHDSEWDDYCSVCGEALVATEGAEAAAAAPDSQSEAATPDPATPDPATPEQAATSCPNCTEATGAADVFCENCGYDFLSGTLPDSGATLAPAEVAASTLGSDPPSVAIVSVDLEFFERMRFDGVNRPSTNPEPVTIDLPPTDILIGRYSASRGTFPEIDLSTVFGDSDATDPAVSSNHCRLHRSGSGWTVTDLGSTNGTYVGQGSDPIVPGSPVDLEPGTPIHLGAWTRIDIA